MRPRYLVTAGAVLLACGPPVAPQPERAATLVVLVTVDQLRSDYLTRFEPQFTGRTGTPSPRRCLVPERVPRPCQHGDGAPPRRGLVGPVSAT